MKTYTLPQALYLYVFVLLGLSSCKEDSPPPIERPIPTVILSEVPYNTLSAYGLFDEDSLSNMYPNARVFPYTLNTALFTDYAYKSRFIYLPEETSIVYRSLEALDFPVGTILVKNFYYYQDERRPDLGKQLIETRLLVHKENGWEAYPYKWNSTQTDADYWPEGKRLDASWIDQAGSLQTISYQIPKRSECQNCHTLSNSMSPIGPSSRNLNMDYSDGGETYNQLTKMETMGWLSNLPPIESIEKAANWEDTTQSLEARARAYLDINCGHCHRPNGPAHDSGLFLYHQENDRYNLGICQVSIPAVSGSGGYLYDIVRGNPESSFLVHRMESNDEALKMPEIGRSVVHKEGVALIAEWIRSMKPNDCP
ncbi:SO2930 family diheme c-type cytochrome [Algivirga pacifica]|uniref:Repeat protein (TIGR03806 family) n=1 Tax=Algivirga pacifica TaxID=1162670 RepID=A0ABP9CWK1_9BACT